MSFTLGMYLKSDVHAFIPLCNLMKRTSVYCKLEPLCGVIVTINKKFESVTKKNAQPFHFFKLFSFMGPLDVKAAVLHKLKPLASLKPHELKPLGSKVE